MSNLSTSHYEVSWKHLKATYRARFPFEDRKYGEAREAALDRIANLKQTADVSDIKFSLVTRKELPYE